MPIKKDVKEVIDFVKSLGLEVTEPLGSGHRKVIDPGTGTYLFGISSSPSDPNWHWMIMRHLRRLGFIGKSGKKRSAYKQHALGGQVKRGKSVIDLVALRKAQAQAEAAGVRIPTLDDLDDSTEFFSKTSYGSNPQGFSPEAQEEAITIMTPRVATAPRLNATRQRLKKFLEEEGPGLVERGKEARSRAKLKGGKVTPVGEFVSMALVVGEKRGIRTFPNNMAGSGLLSNFLKGKKTGLWAVDLIDATLDDFAGLRWNEIDETRKRVTPPPTSQFQTPTEPEAEEDAGIPEDIRKVYEIATARAEIKELEDLAGIESVPLTMEAVEYNGIKERYADALLEILKAEGSQTDEKVLDRLDKLAGIV